MLDSKKADLTKNIETYRMDYRMATAGIKALEDQPNDLTEIIKYMKILYHTDTKLTYDQKVRLFRQFVYKVRLENGVELELYKTPQSDVPQNFRAFPKELRLSKPEVMAPEGSAQVDSAGSPASSDSTSEEASRLVQTPVPNSLRQMLGSNIITPCQVTYRTSHLEQFVVHARG